MDIPIEIVGDKRRVFMLLLLKNFTTRMKNWVYSFIVQVFIPICLILLGQCMSLMIHNTPMHIQHNTYYRIQSKTEILQRIKLFDTIVRYTPDNKVTGYLMENTRICLGLPEEKIIATANEKTIIAKFYDSNETFGEYIGVIFDGITNNYLPNKLKYRFRINTTLPSHLYDIEENGNIANEVFRTVPLIQLQMCLDETFIKLIEPNPRFAYDLSIQQMPYPPYVVIDEFTIYLRNIFTEIACIAFIIISCVEISFPAKEKYTGINILMSVYGVKNFLNLFSWLISCVLYSVSYLLPIVLILKYYMPPKVPPFLSYGNGFFVWLALLMHICHLTAFGYHITAYFWRPSRGIFISAFINILMTIISYHFKGPRITKFFVYLGIICPNLLLKRIFSEINAYEDKLRGIRWSNLFIAGTYGGPAIGSIGMMIFFSILGIIVHLAMTIYVYAVRPGKYGISERPLYFLQNRKVNTNDKSVDFESTKPEGVEFELVQEDDSVPGIRIRNLIKNYNINFSGEIIPALSGVSMDFYESDITVLFGYSGAGKTTLLSILSGLTDATDGIVIINGKNIQHNPDVISNNIGLCPQENMVFPNLNVQQQLMFFGTLKAKTKTKRQLEHEIEVLLAKVNLTDKRTALPNELSGGQKRRLCLAMAVIGDGNVLILDEPTSGMDGESKREVWDIVLKMRGEKTIIISTHDMEEADILGDRIAIMHTGKLKSYGTSMFLKKLYGDGQLEVILSIEPWCDLTKIFEEIGITAQVLCRYQGKVILAIPSIDSLPEVLDKMEISKKKLGITGISVSLITLEQIFIKVSSDDINDEVRSEDPIENYEKVNGSAYYSQCFKAYFLKKILFARRNSWSFWISLSLPSFAIIFILFHFGISLIKDVPLALTLKIYPHSRIIYNNEDFLGQMYRYTVENYFGNVIEMQQGDSFIDTLLNIAKKDVGFYSGKMIIAGEMHHINSTNIKVNGFYSGSATYSIPITINCLSNALLKTLTNHEEYSIEISAQSILGSAAFELGDEYLAFIIAFYMTLSLIPTVAMYVVHSLKESLSEIKHLQEMTSAPKSMYWASMFIFDLVQFFISILLFLLLLILVDICLGTQLYHSQEILITIALLMLFAMSVLPFVYLISFLKNSVTTTMFILILAPMILGVVDVILSCIIPLGPENVSLKMFRKIQSTIFLLVPQVSLMYGYVSFFVIATRNARCRRIPEQLLISMCVNGDECCYLQCSDGVCRRPLAYFVDLEFSHNLKVVMIYLTVSSIIFFILIFIIEQKCMVIHVTNIKTDSETTDASGLDVTIVEEINTIIENVRKRMRHSSENIMDNNIFLALGLKQNYGDYQAVNEISFRVTKGECFGLLGLNGAGKSVILRMITGLEIPQSGIMYLKNYNIATNRVKYLAEMGYCPQHDAIIDTLNAWDHLYLFARLRGIPNNQIHSTVKKWITKLNLTACAGQPSGTYSGGNKRRLNIAMALIGNPSLVLMDEPTTGVDPAARRSLWNTLKSCQDAGQSIILTSHSMEECEVLCNRLVIMIKGQLVCVGASQELKQRFGAGYNIHVKLSSNRSHADVQDIKQHIESKLTCKLSDENTGFIGYHITDPKATWTIMYTMMSELKSEYSCIEDFAVLSATLEQLFIRFSRIASSTDIRTDNSKTLPGDAAAKWWRRLQTAV